MSKKAKHYDKKIFRLVFLLNKLDKGEKISTRLLAQEFNVSQRSVQRDIELLNMTGFPILLLENGRYSFQEGFSLKKMMLSKEEASLLSFTFEMTKSLGDKFEDSFRSLLGKILGQQHNSPFYVKMPDGYKIAKDFPFLKDLEQAVNEFRRVILKYQAKGLEEVFNISPLKVIFFDGFWYLLAQPHDKKGMIKFRLDKINGVKILEQEFEPPANLQMVLDESINIRFSAKRSIKVMLKVGKEASSYFRQRTYVPLQKIKREEKDGSLIVESRISQYAEITPVIFGWVPHIQVLSPAELKSQVRDVMKSYLETS